MLNDIRLYIDKEQLEFKSIPDILYNWNETDFTNPIVTKNSYSKTIKIEGTKQNNKIFGHFWNLERFQLYGGNIGADFNPSYKVPFTLYVDGNLFEKGYVKLQNVTINKGVYEYEIGLFGGLGTFLYNLSVNEDNGSVKTFNALNFYLDNELLDCGFYINKETVLDAWSNINSTTNKWGTINFAPAYTGEPGKFDANKVLINFNGMPTDILPPIVREGDNYYSPDAGDFSIGEMSEALDTWQVKDLRSYMQTPVLRVKSIFDALQRKENSKGKFDDGYEVILDKEFFNEYNPYYQDAYISLPKITTLTFTTEGDVEQTISATSRSTVIDETDYTLTENTTIRFTIPQTISVGGYRGKVKYQLYDMVTRNVGETPSVRDLLMHPAYREGFDFKSPNKTALGAQVTANAVNGTILTGSDITWYTSPSYDREYFSCEEARTIGSYKPPFSTSSINKVNGVFIFESAGTGYSIYRFSKLIEIEVDIPAGTKYIDLNLQRCPQRNENPNIKNTGKKLYEFLSPDTSEYTYLGTFDSSSSGTTDIIGGTDEDSYFYSHRYVKQKDLFSTDYSVSEWLISYCKMFGLYLHKDLTEDKIYIDTRNTYYRRDDVTDINNLIDYSKVFSIKPIYATNKFYTLTNPMEKSTYSETYKNNNGEDYGMKLVNTGFEFDASRKELLDKFKIKTGVPATKQDIYYLKPKLGLNPYVYNGFTYTLYKDGSFDNEDSYDYKVDKREIMKVYEGLSFDEDYPLYDKTYKMCFEDDGKEVNPSNVFLFYNGDVDISDLGYWLTDDLTVMNKLNNKPCWIMTRFERTSSNIEVAKQLNAIPLFSSYYTLNGKEIVFSSNFGSPRELYTRKDELQNHDEATLYSQFYSKYYEDLYDINTKVVECYVKPDTILNADYLRKLYWFNNSIWRLNKVTDYSPVKNETVKCQFIKVNDINALTNEVPDKRLRIFITLDNYSIGTEGGRINGHIKVSDYGSWSYEDSTVDGVVVTPTYYREESDITIDIPAYTGDMRTIQVIFSAGDAAGAVEIEQTNSGFIRLTPSTTEIPYSGGAFTYSIRNNPGCTVEILDEDDTIIFGRHYSAGNHENETYRFSPNTQTTPVTYTIRATSDNFAVPVQEYTLTQGGAPHTITVYVLNKTSVRLTPIIKMVGSDETVIVNDGYTDIQAGAQIICTPFVSENKYKVNLTIPYNLGYVNKIKVGGPYITYREYTSVMAFNLGMQNLTPHELEYVNISLHES